MRHVIAIARREVRSYFLSPIACGVITLFTFVSGLFFSNMLVYYAKQATLADRQIEQLGRSELQLDVPTMVIGEFFKNEAFIVMLVVPLLTMGLITDERRKGTLELLLTSPVRASELVAGKCLGALSLFLLMLLPTMPFFYFLAQGGEWEPGVVASGYFGLVLLGATGIAVGLWVSSLCENVLVSAIGTYGILLTFTFLDTSSSAARSVWVDFINFLSLYTHEQNLARGLVALRDVAYFTTLIALGLFLAHRSIEAIRFKRS
jgi:ABC-2 type transport system permease protein